MKTDVQYHHVLQASQSLVDYCLWYVPFTAAFINVCFCYLQHVGDIV